MTPPKSFWAGNLFVVLLFVVVYVIAFFGVLSIRWLGYVRGGVVIAVAVVFLSFVTGASLRMRGDIPQAGFLSMMWEGFKALALAKRPNKGDKQDHS